MATGIYSGNSSVVTYLFGRSTFFAANPTAIRIMPQSLSSLRTQKKKKKKKNRSLSLWAVTEEKKEDSVKIEKETFVETENQIKVLSRVQEKEATKKIGETNIPCCCYHVQSWLLFNGCVSCLLQIFMANGGELQLLEMFSTFALSVGSAVGMEFWARWAHRALWHASLWHMHEGCYILCLSYVAV